jgi:acid stress-induced BolA-like protein IbaG/YrbA
MDSLTPKVKEILLRRFSESDIRLEDTDDNKVFGFVVSPAFQKKTSFTRQKMIWALLNTS